MSPAGKGSQGAMTLAPQQYAEQEATDALALAPLTDAQAADLIDHLPAVQPEVAALTNALQVFDRIPVGLGAHGPIHQAVERVRVAEIWADEDLYVFGEADEAKLSDEDIRNLLASYRDHAVTDATGYIRQHTFSPLILIARPNPARPTRQRLLLLRDLATLQAARLLEWDVVEAIVYPDMSDFDIRNVGLHLALRATPPTRLEVLRQVLLMGEDWRRGRRAASSKRPSQTDLAAILGCSQSCASGGAGAGGNPCCGGAGPVARGA